MAAESFHFLIAAVVLAIEPIVVWKIAEAVDRWWARRRRRTSGRC